MPPARAKELVGDEALWKVGTQVRNEWVRATGVGETELREEYEDGLEYNKSADGRRAIEEKRVLLLGSTASRYATAARSPHTAVRAT